MKLGVSEGAIAAAPGGLRAVAAWMAAWTKGKQGHQEMKAWTTALIIPLDRDGARVRPIALTEARVKLAQGTLMERIHRKPRKNAEPSKTETAKGKAQHIGQFAGAEVLARIVRGRLKDRPAETLVQLDLSTAYGSVHRHLALWAVNTQLPELSAMLAAGWANERTSAWVQREARWQQLVDDRAAWQAAPHSNVAFCCVLTAAQYADDCFNHGTAGTVVENWDDLKAKLKEEGDELQDKRRTACTKHCRPERRRRKRLVEHA